MIELDKENLRKLQLIQLEMLVELDRICTKCHIHYNIIAGTLLGAVRHGGYIPWDDDADVALLRSEYEKFRVACDTELDASRFYFQDHRNTSGYRWGYGKLRRKNTLFLRQNQEHMPYEQGVFIDVFPLDGVPDSYAGRCFHNFYCFSIRKLLWSKVGKYAAKNMVMRILYSFLSCIPREIIMDYYEAFIRESNKNPHEKVRILLFPTPNHTYGYKKRWYEESMLIKFEGCFFSGIRAYEEYLNFKFGDYRELPPEEQRKTHPVSQLQLIRE